MNHYVEAATPGPWRVGPLSARHILGPQRPDATGRREGVAITPCVAIVSERTGETSANAALLAAAPELFAALSQLTEAYLDANGQVELPAGIDESLLYAAAKALASADPYKGAA